jgi:hypothetical protein
MESTHVCQGPLRDGIANPPEIVLTVARRRSGWSTQTHEGFMKSLRVSLALAAFSLLPASTLSAQATRIACKDGSVPKVGHFTCWGHGGVVSVPVKKARTAEKKKPAAKAATRPVVKQAGKPVSKKKKAAAKAHPRRTTKGSAK